MMIKINWERQSDENKVDVVVVRDGLHRSHNGVSIESLGRLGVWLRNQYPRVYGGGNYHGADYEVEER